MADFVDLGEGNFINLDNVSAVLFYKQSDRPYAQVRFVGDRNTFTYGGDTAKILAACFDEWRDKR